MKTAQPGQSTKALVFLCTQLPFFKRCSKGC